MKRILVELLRTFFDAAIAYNTKPFIETPTTPIMITIDSMRVSISEKDEDAIDRDDVIVIS